LSLDVDVFALISLFRHYRVVISALVADPWSVITDRK
jgi:hypothetical protein